jgi:hypothetical protein
MSFSTRARAAALVAGLSIAGLMAGCSAEEPHTSALDAAYESPPVRSELKLGQLRPRARS